MAGFFEIYVRKDFAAAHCLKGYPGDCARVHGHNWVVEVFVACKELDDVGMGIDFRQVKEAVSTVLQQLDHTHLNEVAAFRQVNPTSEHVAKYIYEQLGEQLNSDVIHVSRVSVSETPDCGASYWEG